MAATRLVVILTRRDTADGRPVFSYIVRANVPVARQPIVVNPNYVSPFVPKGGDTDPDASGLKDGSIVERLGEVVVSSTLPLAEIRNLLVRMQQDYQTEITGDKTYQRYGSYFDGAAWTAQGA